MLIDTSELRQFSSEIEAALKTKPRQVRALVSKGALNIKNAWNADAAASTHFSPIAGTVNYDIKGVATFVGTSFEAEIGPDKRRRAARMANIWIFGTSRGGGTGRDPREYLDDEVPAFMKYLGDLGEAIT